MSETVSRAEHLQWCKDRALAYLDKPNITHEDIHEAFTSMMSDLDKHEETKGHPAQMLGMMLLMNGHLNNIHEMREFILGFN